jgi:hypothetical protein
MRAAKFTFGGILRQQTLAVTGALAEAGANPYGEGKIVLDNIAPEPLMGPSGSYSAGAWAHSGAGVSQRYQQQRNAQHGPEQQQQQQQQRQQQKPGQGRGPGGKEQGRQQHAPYAPVQLEEARHKIGHTLRVALGLPVTVTSVHAKAAGQGGGNTLKVTIMPSEPGQARGLLGADLLRVRLQRSWPANAPPGIPRYRLQFPEIPKEEMAMHRVVASLSWNGFLASPGASQEEAVMEIFNEAGCALLATLLQACGAGQGQHPYGMRFDAGTVAAIEDALQHGMFRLLSPRAARYIGRGCDEFDLLYPDSVTAQVITATALRGGIRMRWCRDGGEVTLVIKPRLSREQRTALETLRIRIRIVTASRGRPLLEPSRLMGLYSKAPALCD